MILFYSHALLMGTGFLLMTAGVGTARFLRQRRWWLKAHRALGTAGAFCLAAGLAAALGMIARSGGGHFQIPHAWLGLTAVLTGIGAPIVGSLQFRIKARTRQLRRWHRGVGYSAATVTLLSLLSGLAAAGII